MSGRFQKAMLLLARKSELSLDARIWGDGDWRPPDDREALDWLTLARISGWNVAVAHHTDSWMDGDPFKGSRWIVIACDPEGLGEEIVAKLTLRLQSEPILVVSRVASANSAMARLSGISCPANRSVGKDLRWIGPGPKRSWACRNPVEFTPLRLTRDVSTWAVLDGAPVIAARRIGAGAIAILGCHPSTARDADGAATALLRHLLVCGAQAPIAWLDWEGTLVLRMDDPGGAQNVFKQDWCYPKLSEHQWAAIGEDLQRRRGRISVAYVAGWVDDADRNRGSLTVDGRMVERVPGAVHPSPLVRYVDHTGHAPTACYDYSSEFAGIQALRAAGLAEVELHGYTHMHPDSVAWAQASDRYNSTGWFRELGERALPTLAQRSPDEHPLALGMDAFHRFFNVRPTTLISPGDDWTNEALERALELGIQVIDSYYLAIRDGNRFCWCTHVCSPYLNEPEARWFDSGLPVVGYFHDLEPAQEGVGWMGKWLDRWQEEGAQRLVDFRELAASVGRVLLVEEMDGRLQLRVIKDPDVPDLIRPLRVKLHCPNDRLPSHVSVSCGDDGWILEVSGTADGFSRIEIPTSEHRIASLSGGR